MSNHSTSIKSQAKSNARPIKAEFGDKIPAIDSIPIHSALAIGRIFDEGEPKYGRDNWKHGVGDPVYQRERLKHAMVHLQLWANGNRDEAHLAKVAWFCVTQLELERLERIENASKTPTNA